MAAAATEKKGNAVAAVLADRPTTSGAEQTDDVEVAALATQWSRQMSTSGRGRGRGSGRGRGRAKPTPPDPSYAEYICRKLRAHPSRL